ncbi:MAG: branched-chain amino acid ABC transporter substrate-binding protein [Anaerolineae bacterium]|nr:branched-chain amino acid ABC transporter substrate-binding protein [Anaerolineae bacterium]
MRRRAVLGLPAYAGLLAACGGRSTPRGEITVYVAVPLSGFQANGGQTVLGGARLRAEQANAQGGVLNRRIVVEGVDDEADSEVAVEVARQIAAEVGGGKEVLGIIGHYNSGQTLAAMEIYADVAVNVVTPTASNVNLTRLGYRNFFRVNATDATQGRVDAEFLVGNLGATRIAVAHLDDDYGNGLRDLLVENLARLGANVAADIVVEEAVERHDAAVEQIGRVAPDAVFLAAYETEGYVLLPQLRQAGIDAPFMASDACFLSAFIDESGEAAEGAYVSGFTPSPSTVVSDDWVRQYQAVEQRNPDTYSIVGYMAMDVLIRAAQEARTVAAEPMGDAIRRLDYQGLAGRIAYDETGDLRDQRVYVFQVREGQFVQVTP